MNRLRRIKHLIPYPIRNFISFLRLRERWLSILLSKTPDRGQVRVFYGLDYIPHPGEPACGGIVKFQRIQSLFPNSLRRFNLLYILSSTMPEDWAQLLWLARHKGVRVVLNQNGVAYPAWHGQGWEQANQPLAKMVHAADYVFYQSRFCKLSADRFLGERHGPWDILYNAADTNVFTPAESDPDPRHLVLLLGGSQYQYYRLESALRTVAILAHKSPSVRLLVTGRLRWILDEAETAQIARQLINDLGIADHVVFLGPYTQAEAPTIFRQAHLLLHTQYNDASPAMVIEAMACGLPVVYSHSGGVPELVGDEAGIGVRVDLSWERVSMPDPNALAEAVLCVAERRSQYAEAARQRAVEHFDLRPWLQRHREVFEELVCK